MNFCLSDLVPPLRWSDASTITLLTGQPELPDAWWRSLPMPLVLAAIGPESLAELLTEIALEHWPAAAVGDVLPALHVLDPDEADEPQVAIALDRAGSWSGLLALTGRELVDQPFIQARPVLNTLFSAALVHLAPQLHRPSAPVSAPAPALAREAVPVALPVEAPPSAEPARVAEQARFAEQAPIAEEAPEREEEPDAEEAVAAEEAMEPQEAVEDAAEAEEPVLDADDEPVVDEAAEPEPEPEPVLDATDEPAPEPADEEAAALEAEGAEPEPVPEPQDAEAVPEPEPEPAPEEAKPKYDTPPDFEAAESADPEPEEPAGHELPELIEAAFAGLDDKSWAVAQNRVFTDQPSAVDQLAKLFAVPPADISATETELRARLGQWLASEEAAPYRAHLDELRRTIGPAAAREQLIGAADWHAQEIRALEVPAWQFVLATLPSEAAAVPSEAVAVPSEPPAPEPQVVEVAERPASAFAQVPPIPSPPPGTPQFQAFAPAEVMVGEGNGASNEPAKPYQPLKDVSQTRRCFRQPDGRWWLRIDVTAEQLGGGECALPTGFATYLGLSPGESRTVRSAAGELTMVWHGRPVLESVERLLADVGAKEGGHLFLTLSDEGVLRARHLPVAAQGAEKITKALRLVGYTAPGGTRDQAARVIATRIGMTGPVGLPDLLTRLRERGDRDLLQLLG